MNKYINYYPVIVYIFFCIINILLTIRKSLSRKQNVIPFKQVLLILTLNLMIHIIFIAIGIRIFIKLSESGKETEAYILIFFILVLPLIIFFVSNAIINNIIKVEENIASFFEFFI